MGGEGPSRALADLGQTLGLLAMPEGPAAAQGQCKGQSTLFGVKDLPEESDSRKSADGTIIGSTANASESIVLGGPEPHGGA